MKILYISSLVFKKGSSASIRNTGLINGLIEIDNEVDILTISYPPIMKDEGLQKKIEGKCQIVSSKLNFLENYLINVQKVKRNMILMNLKNIIKDIIFFPDVDKEWINKIDMKKQYNYDLIISSSDTKTSHYVAEKIIKNNKKIKWIQIWGDPWAADINLSRLKKMRVKYAEKKIISKADKVFYVSPFTLKKMKQENINLAEKLNYLPRGYLEEIKKDVNEEKNFIKFVYTGVLNKNRNLIDLLRVIEKYNVDSKIKIILEIYGNAFETELQEILNYKFVEYKGVVSSSEIKKVYKTSDVLIFLENIGETTQIPGKIYDYLGTECKILALFENENEIYKYFIETLKINSYLNKELDTLLLDKFLKEKNRKIDLRYSNKNIALKLIKEIKG